MTSTVWLIGTSSLLWPLAVWGACGPPCPGHQWLFPVPCSPPHLLPHPPFHHSQHKPYDTFWLWVFADFTFPSGNDLTCIVSYLPRTYLSSGCSFSSPVGGISFLPRSHGSSRRQPLSVGILGLQQYLTSHVHALFPQWPRELDRVSAMLPGVLDSSRFTPLPRSLSSSST